MSLMQPGGVLMLALKYKNGDNVSESVGLLISILLRYPEVGTIHFDPKRKNIKISFMLLKKIPEPVLKQFRNKLLSCLETLHFLEDQDTELVEFDYSYCEDITLLDYSRDLKTLKTEEISLTIAMVRESFKEYILSDPDETEIEEDLLFQEELIGKMLESAKYSSPDKKLIAFREEGRVLIYNK